jgi:alditol oxidase
MKKRSFLKLIATLMLKPTISPLFAWAGKLTNWAGNIVYSTDNLTSATSIDEARSFVKTHGKFKVLGTRHCFNTIADSTDSFLSLRSMEEVFALDTAAKTVTVQSGITYGRLAPYLHSKGFALHNLASLPHISVAGACTTATHGSGEKNGNLATEVAALEFLTPAGDIVELSRAKDGDTFKGAVVGLGALGVITKVTLDIQPTFLMRQYVYQGLSFDAMKQHFDAIESSAYSVSLFTDWQNKVFSEVWLKCREDHKPAFDAKPEFFGAKLADKNLHPIAALSPENCTEQMGVVGPWYERLPHFKMGFTPSAGKELQSEYFVSREHAVEAIFAVEKLASQITPHLLITEIRAIAADDLWMSPCYKQNNIAIHFTWKQEWQEVKNILPQIERALAPYNPRPHWGKLFTVPPKELRSKYARIHDFIQLSQKYDPKGTLRNAFLETNIFS